MLKQRDLIGCIFHMAQMLERMCDSNARMTGLTGSQARLLCFLSIVTLNEEVFQKDIEKVFGIRPSSATGLLGAGAAGFHPARAGCSGCKTQENRPDTEGGKNSGSRQSNP